MKIVIDLTIVRETNKITGIERVAIETLKSLLTNRYANFKYHIICSKKGYVYIKRIIESIVQSPKDIEVFQSPFENRIITDQIWMPNIIKKISPDYVYYTTLGVPFLQRFPFSIIVHDVVAWVMPDTISKGMKYYYKPLIEKALKNKKNTNIVTVSSFSKKSIVEELGVKEDKIVVNYLGISSNFIEKENTYNPNEVLGKYGISKEYIIALGTIEPRKNIEGAIKAFAIMKEKYNYKGQLVIVGREGWIKNFNISESIASEIVITGFVSDQDLPIILSQSKAFIFPSYYEGFGLPMIEAMSLGVPVISSRVASLPEIGGESCEYFNPYLIEEIAETIYQTINNDKKLQELSISGKERAKLFNWKRHGEIVENIILQGVNNGEK